MSCLHNVEHIHSSALKGMLTLVCAGSTLGLAFEITAKCKTLNTAARVNTRNGTRLLHVFHS